MFRMRVKFFWQFLIIFSISQLCGSDTFDIDKFAIDAALEGHVSRLCFALNYRPDLVNTSRFDIFNSTLLYCAAHNGHDKAVLLLLDRGAQSDVGNDIGQTPLHVAAERGYVKIVRALLCNMNEKGILSALNIKDINGMTSLHRAAQNNWSRTIELLKNYGPDPTIEDNEGKRPSQMTGGKIRQWLLDYERAYEFGFRKGIKRAMLEREGYNDGRSRKRVRREG